MKCYIKGYNKSKYEADAEKVFQYDLEEVKDFEVIHGEQSLKGYEVDKALEDDFHEYLVIYFEDGTSAIYQNSRVALFKY